MRKYRSFAPLMAVLAMLALIMDGAAATDGALQGIELCIRTVIPALFPYLVLSIYLTGQLSAMKLGWLRPLGRLMRLPQNAEIIFLIGLLGGYPMGAQSIRQCFDRGILRREDAQRMLFFCSNGGPAFLFGIGGRLLDDPRHCWLAWLVHILSAVLVSLAIPAHPPQPAGLPDTKAVSLTEAVRRSAGVMAVICSWIVLFRILLAYMDRWLLCRLPPMPGILVSGLLELTNGCAKLAQLSNAGHRFFLFTSMLGFGGICVGLQTAAVLSGSGLSVGPYFLGKLAQAALSMLMSMLLFPNILPRKLHPFLSLAAAAFVFLIFLHRKRKNGIAFQKQMVYNGSKYPGGSTYETVPKKG